ncbi:MAG: PEP-CTERM sorting domain-containing protein [Candidatus Limnocylindria bacterium]
MKRALGLACGSALATLFCFWATAPASAAPFAFSVRSDVDDILYQINLATGVSTPIGSGVGFGDVEALTFSSSGTLFGIDDTTDQLITINTTTGVGTAVGQLGVSFTDMGLTFDAAGNLWMSTDAPPPWQFYSVNPGTGEATLVGAQGQQVTGLAGQGSVVYGLGGDETNNLVTINTGTGAATVIGPLVNVSLSDGGIDFDPATGVLWGIRDGATNNIFTIDPSTGTATVVATTLNGFEGLAIPQAVVPEPAIVLLVGSGLVALAAWRRRRSG